MSIVVFEARCPACGEMATWTNHARKDPVLRGIRSNVTVDCRVCKSREASSGPWQPKGRFT